MQKIARLYHLHHGARHTASIFHLEHGLVEFGIELFIQGFDFADIVVAEGREHFPLDRLHPSGEGFQGFVLFAGFGVDAVQGALQVVSGGEKIAGQRGGRVFSLFLQFAGKAAVQVLHLGARAKKLVLKLCNLGFGVFFLFTGLILYGLGRLTRLTGLCSAFRGIALLAGLQRHLRGPIIAASRFVCVVGLFVFAVLEMRFIVHFFYHLSWHVFRGVWFFCTVLIPTRGLQAGPCNPPWE